MTEIQNPKQLAFDLILDISIWNLFGPISGLPTPIGKTSREALISKEPTKYVVKISVNSDATEFIKNK